MKTLPVTCETVDDATVKEGAFEGWRVNEAKVGGTWLCDHRNVVRMHASRKDDAYNVLSIVSENAALRARFKAVSAALNATAGALDEIRNLWAGHSEQCAYVLTLKEPHPEQCDCDWPKIAARCDAALALALGVQS